MSLKHQKLLGRHGEVVRKRNNKKSADLKLCEKISGEEEGGGGETLNGDFNY